MIFRTLAELPENFGPSALTIGNFDGVHAGHRYILHRLTQIGVANGWTPTVLTFDPHPMRLLAPERAPKLLSSPEERCEWMRQCGIERIVILPFTENLARLSPEEFVRWILVTKLRARAVLVGENFRFGNRAAGNIEKLRELGEENAFRVEAVSPVVRRGRVVSSSEVRRLVETGDVSMACRLLERPFALEGRVVSGQGIGAKHTVPTLNLETRAEVLPAVGVYMTRTFEPGGDRRWESITNVGYRPTFGGKGLTVETFLLSPLFGGSPAEIRVEFHKRVRDERKFDSPEALRAQILRDVARTQTYFRRVGRLWVVA